MRGFETNEKRFDNINLEPDCSTKVKNTQLPPWIHSEPGTSKTMNFDLPSYCNGSYKPDINPIKVKLDVGCKFYFLAKLYFGIRDLVQ